MSELGLSEHHQNQIVNYLRFVRYQRGQRLRAIDHCFEDVKSSRLLVDSTFTRDEVTEMLDSLVTVVRGEVETELINYGHTNVLLLRQMCSQAEKWHLSLDADISELENRELLDAIQTFEEQEFSLAKGQNAPLTALSRKLEPVEGGPVLLLQAEIDRLKIENSMLRSRMNQVEMQACVFVEDKNRLSKELQLLQKENSTVENSNSNGTAVVQAIEAKMAELQTMSQQELEASQSAQKCLETDLTSTKHKLLEIQSQLSLAEKQLEKNFSQTAVYQNMKKMITKKNDQLKELRSRLEQYEPVVDTGDV